MEETFLEIVQREFRRLKGTAEGAMAQLADAQFFATLDVESNPTAILVKHMAGNLRSRWTDFLTSDGEKADRNRDNEFVLLSEDTRPSLMTAWEQGWQCLFDALACLTERDLMTEVRIRGEAFSVTQAIVRQLTHYGYHVGQIVFLAKHLVGPQWKTLSVPRGASATFNAAPRPYLQEDAPDER